MLLLKAAPEPFGLLPAYIEHDIDSPCWLWHLLSPDHRREVIDRTKAALAQHEFDAIAFSGLSGALIAPIVALEMNKTLLCVRKKGEERHAGGEVHGDVNAQRYIILDDFVSTGTTVRRIERLIREWCIRVKCVGVIEHGSPLCKFTPANEFAINNWEEWNR